MMLPFSVVLIGAALTVAVSDRMPDYDIRPSCHGATELMSLDPAREKRCIDDEESARADAAKQWASFPAADRERCTAESQLDGSPSYVDLFECLTLAREAKAGEKW